MNRNILYFTALFAAFAQGAIADTPPSFGSLETPADDLHIRQMLNQQLGQLADDPSLPRLSELNEQLNRTRPCNLPVQPAAASEPANPVDMLQALRHSSLLISSVYKCDRCDNWHLAGTASGFAIAPDIIVTNHHVVSTDGDTSGIMGVMTHDGRCYPVIEVLAADEQSDLAILRVKSSDLRPLPLSSGDPVGSQVTVASHPDGRVFSVTQGIISRYFLQPVPPDHQGPRATWMSITADFAKGSSGAAVVNAAGQVCGIVAMTNSIYYGKPGDDPSATNPLQMVVKSCVPVRDLLRLIGPPPAEPDPGQQAEATEPEHVDAGMPY